MNRLRWVVVMFLAACSSGGGNGPRPDGGSDCTQVCDRIAALGCPISNCVSDCMTQLTAAQIACLKQAPTCMAALQCQSAVGNDMAMGGGGDMGFPNGCITVITSTTTGSTPLGSSCQAALDCQSGDCARFGSNGYCTIPCLGTQDCTNAGATGADCLPTPSGTSYCLLSAMAVCP